eukprot:135348-Prorocentrum_lima.AAC.1
MMGAHGTTPVDGREDIHGPTHQDNGSRSQRPRGQVTTDRIHLSIRVHQRQRRGYQNLIRLHGMKIRHQGQE